tara:strand:- start:823 stop:984 length:162 start_codon:yes stop_codon:yes gene_type:complete
MIRLAFGISEELDEQFFPKILLILNTPTKCQISLFRNDLLRIPANGFFTCITL